MPTTSSIHTVEVTEGAPWATLRVSVEQAAEIAALKIGSISPLPSGEWRITGIRKVGVIRIGDTELRILPKTPIDRLFYLLSRGNQWGEWFDEDAFLSTSDTLYAVIAEVFGRWGERVMRAGVLQGYEERRSAEPFIRGRWLVTEQIGRRRTSPRTSW
jgi:5-methylcytosine-specific restriction enzyme subunit McrC